MTILNRQHHYIFIHVPKAAGKSVKSHLANCSFEQRSRIELQLGQRLETLGSYAGGKPILSKLIPALLGPGIDPRLRSYCKAKGMRTSAHLTAAQLRDALGMEAFNAMYSFAFVRNPWDRCLSAYFYFRRKKLHPLHEAAKRLEFDVFLEEQEIQGMPFVGQQSWWLFSDKGEQLASFIGKVENISADMAIVQQHIGIEGAPFQTRTNVSQDRARDYRGYYSSRALDVVNRAMSQDISQLGYQFE
ncbi:MAG: hypothetical protein ACI9NT_001308 [Bacteroidia bacterium]|jgi:hypothetical protein